MQRSYRGPVYNTGAMLPKEHGAYGQLILPLATALAVAGVSVPALATGAAVTMAFLAHEPLLVLLGSRGTRARREQGPAALRWLLGTATAAVSAGGIAVWLTAAQSRWGFVAPLLPACAVAAEVVRGRDKSALAEVGVALAFSLTALPVCLAAGTTVVTGMTVALPFAVIFVAATLAVRGVTAAGRGVDPHSVRSTRLSALLVAAGGVTALAWAASAQRLPWPAAFASLPGAAVAAFLALAPSPARQLRRVGWLLVAVAVLASLTLVAATWPSG